MEVQSGREGNVKYSITLNGMQVILDVENVVTNKKKMSIYQCEQKPLYGYSKHDVTKFEAILDSMIVEVM